MSADTDRSFGAVIRDIGGNVNRIIRAELRFAVAELRIGLTAAGAGAMLVLAGALCATLAAGFLLLGAMFALALVMPTWAAALIIALVVGSVAAVLLVKGRTRLVHPLAPLHTAVALHEDSPE